jgi:hypothetical protein
LQLVLTGAAGGHGFLAGRCGLGSELAAHTLSAGGRFVLRLACFALHALRHLGCLGPCPALHVCLGGQLLDRLTELFAGPLYLLLQLLNIIRRRRQATTQRAFPLRVIVCGTR